MRVISGGSVRCGDAFELVEGHPERISIAAVNDIIFGRSEEAGLIEELANLPEFGADGRALFASRLGRRREASGE
jgi:MOSC domain-containing protein YiiM